MPRPTTATQPSPQAKPGLHLPPSLHALAHDTLSDPAFHLVSTTRAATHAGRGHTLMDRTWNTPSTIPELHSFFRAGSPATGSGNGDDNDASTRAEVRRFYEFGGDLNAHPDLLHGGVVSCILDSGMGAVVALAMGRGSDAAPKEEYDSVRRGEGGGPPRFTAQLNVRYRRPVRTPGCVVVRGWVEREEGGGRKVWARGVVEALEGGRSVVHAEGEGLWVSGKNAKI
ncbi:uncharacterized protein HMPREF1541_10481 [Cyphellophora europaea CBS 101466]|uniref:Thioesterase domain-containing protein n=1 Tax=Cyphellophora europaea (strain CBS 101466) TaxID=1220924 RepID=W2S6H5_CYPE1|nr:uncharacterized protein HMPREF1541_10481 [Cyphellophora europaea CBS 101466]ETN44301.1 hypothetical protein HMPREF1541_10481 [Cyphellophora europaea CBS 101466]